MQVSVETTEGLERRMTVEVPAERIDGEVDSRLKKYARTIRMDGFRPGKVPVKVVRQQYGAAIRQEVLGDVIQTTLQEAFQQEQINPAGMPSVESVSDSEGESFSYAATFEVYPEITVGDMSELAIEVTEAEISDDDMKGMMDKLMDQQASWDPVEREAVEGDRIVVDYEGSMDGGEAFPGNKREDAAVVLGSGNLGKEFEDALVGGKAGEDLSFDVTFPDDYRIDELQGKTAHFEVKVKNVLEKVLPELNDEFAASLGITEGGIEALDKQVRDNMNRELKHKLRSLNKDNVLDALLAANPVDLPKAMVEDEAKRMAEQMMQQIAPAAGGQDLDLPTSAFEGQATRRVSLGLLLGEVIKSQEMAADEDKVSELINDIAETYEKPEEVVESYRANSQMMQEVEALAMEEQAVEWILEQANVTQVTASFDEVMNRGNSNVG